MPPNSKNNKLSFKESSVSTNEVEALETQETIEPKSKKMSKIVPNEDMPQKGAGKVKITKEAEAEVEIEASEPPKLKGKGKAYVVKVEEPVKEEPVEEEPVKEEPVKVKSKGKAKAKDDVKEVEKVVEVEKVLVKKTNGSKSKADNTTKATKATKANKANKATKDDETTAKEVEGKSENETTVEGETDIEKYVRSFKVLLPGNQEFIGRYTGLTPYQAANKALSKFFRENKTIKTTTNEITFSIRESTRGSKRSTYTYNGTREKLENPVKYSINGLDGNAREIIKEYKNKLTKVKKSESDVLVNETTTSS
jgi:hypothetical protein